MGINNYESYTAELYNTKGQKISYDSTTGKYETIDEKNTGNMISVKYLFLLLILILFQGLNLTNF